MLAVRQDARPSRDSRMLAASQTGDQSFVKKFTVIPKSHPKNHHLDHSEYKSYKIYLCSCYSCRVTATCCRLIILGGITLVIRIASMIVRVGVLIELALGILFWTGNADSFQIVHIVIGILVVLSLWTLGIALGLLGGSFGLPLAAFVIGFLLVLVGLFQTRWLEPNNHWIIQVIHLLLGLSAIGLAEMISGRYRRMTAKKVVA